MTRMMTQQKWQEKNQEILGNKKLVPAIGVNPRVVPVVLPSSKVEAEVHSSSSSGVNLGGAMVSGNA